MTDIIIADDDAYIQYTASASQTVFDYDFPIFDQDHLVVEKTATDGTTITTLVRGTDYTVAGVGVASGGSITLTTGATDGEIFTLYRDIPVARSTDYTLGGDFTAAAINLDLDKIIQMIQQNERDFLRTMRLKKSDSGSTDGMELPIKANRAGKYVAFDANGDISPSSGTGTDSTLRTDLADSTVTKGADLVAGADKIVASMSALLSESKTNGRVVTLERYHTDGPGIGRRYKYDSSKDRAEHNGGTVIDPTRTFPSDWTNEAQKTAWYTASTGAGCFVLVDDYPLVSTIFGTKLIGSTCDDTKAFQALVDYGTSLTNTDGIQSERMEIGAGRLYLTDTINNTNAKGHFIITGGDGRTTSIVWGGGAKAVFDLGAKGENFRLNDVTCLTESGGTEPTHWIKTTTALDVGFDLKGCAFSDGSIATIECTGIINAYLHNFRVDNVDGPVLLVNCNGTASGYRNIVFTEMTVHNRTGECAPTSYVKFVDFQASDTYHVTFDKCRFEIEDDPVADPTNPGIGADWSYVDLNATGALTASPHIMVTFKETNSQYNGGGSGKDSNILKATSATTDVLPVLSFDGAVFDDLTDFANGNISSTFEQPTGTTYANYKLSGTIGSGKFADVSRLVSSYNINDRFRIAPVKALTDGSVTELLDITLGSDSHASLIMKWGIEATDGTDFQNLSGITTITAANKAGVKSATVTTDANNASNNVTAGTLTGTVTAASSAAGIKIRMTGTSSLTTTAMNLYYTIENQSDQAISIL